MRPKTRSSGIFSTKRKSAVSVSRLTRMFVPKPKKAFQSPGTHNLGLLFMIFFLGFYDGELVSEGCLFKRCQNLFRMRHPAEDAALGLDHFQAHVMKFREIGTDAILRHETVVTAVVGFADGGVHADFRGDTGDDELFDAAILQDGVQVGGPERTLARFINHRLAENRVKLGNDVMP